MLKFDYEDFNKRKLKQIFSIFGNPFKTKVAYFSTYYPNYTRTESLLAYLDDLDITYDFVGTRKTFFRYAISLSKLIKNINKYDVIFVSFRGHEILPFVKIISMIFNKPIIYDVFISVYDTLCFDRQIFKPSSIIGILLKKYDRFLCHISDVVLVDTKTHKEYFEKEFKVDNVEYIYVGCNKKMFKPLEVKKETDKFVVFWYGSSNPLQGVDVILKAAKRLENNKNILFRLGGPVKEKYQDLITELNLNNIEFLGMIPYDKLPLEIAKADLCLGGHFSNLPKANRVIPGKVFQFVNMDKATILGDTRANRESFISTINKIYFCPVNNSEVLSKLIAKLA